MSERTRKADLTSDQLRELDDEYAGMSVADLKTRIWSVDRDLESHAFEVNRLERRKRILTVALDESQRKAKRLRRKAVRT